MIHKDDERFFRAIEVVCYFALVLAVPALRVTRQHIGPYSMPIMFVAVASAGLVFMARFFVYARPESIADRTRAERIVIPREKKFALAIGFAMAFPMLVLGCVGIFNPAAMNRVISIVSPVRFILADGQESAVVIVGTLSMAAGVIVIGAACDIRRMIWLGVTLTFITAIGAFALLR